MGQSKEHGDDFQRGPAVARLPGKRMLHRKLLNPRQIEDVTHEKIHCVRILVQTASILRPAANYRRASLDMGQSSTRGPTASTKFAANGSFSDNLALAQQEKDRRFVDSIRSGDFHNPTAAGMKQHCDMLGRMAGCLGHGVM